MQSKGARLDFVPTRLHVYRRERSEDLLEGRDAFGRGLARLADPGLEGFDKLLRRATAKDDESARANAGADKEGQAHGIPGSWKLRLIAI